MLPSCAIEWNGTIFYTDFYFPAVKLLLNLSSFGMKIVDTACGIDSAGSCVTQLHETKSC